MPIYFEAHCQLLVQATQERWDVQIRRSSGILLTLSSLSTPFTKCSMPTYFVTGTAGFIGFHLTAIAEMGTDVVGLDNVNDTTMST